MRKQQKSGSGARGPRPSLRQGLDGRQFKRMPAVKMDRRLGPWAYYWPAYYSTYSNVYTGAVDLSSSDSDENTYFGGVPTSADEGLPALPRQWIGKTLIRSGQKPAEIISSGKITPTQANKYVFEDKIAQMGRPYIVLNPNEVTSDYITGRLTIYVDNNGVIESVRYG